MSDQMTAVTNPANVKNVIHFGVGKEGNRFLVSGWGVPEDGFVWSEGCFSNIIIPIAGRCSSLSFSLWGYVPKGAPQNILIFANGILISACEVTDKAIIKTNLENILVSNNLNLQLFLPNAQSPKHAEGVPDDRRLGIALAALAFT